MTNKQIVEFVIVEFEGGGKQTNDIHDGGGDTKFGVSIHGEFNDYLGRKATHEDIANLTFEQAVDVGLWMIKRHNIHLLSDWRARLLVFDWCFNAGADDGIPTLQRAVRAHIDGKLGPVTASLANAMNAHVLAMSYLADRQRTHVARSANGHKCKTCKLPSQKRFLGGWVARCSRLLEVTAQ